MTFDMTRGSPGKLLLRFALPLILSSIVQQLYTLCDSVIVGRLLGENAFAAVGAAAFLHGIPLSILLGGTQGFGVALGQRFGAKDEEGLTRFFSAAMVLSLGLGLPGLYVMDAAAWIPVALFLFVCYRRILRQRLANQPENLQKEAQL